MVELHVTEAGQGEAMVLLHGNNEDSTYFEHQIPEFAKHFHVLQTLLAGVCRCSTRQNQRAKQVNTSQARVVGGWRCFADFGFMHKKRPTLGVSPSVSGVSRITSALRRRR